MNRLIARTMIGPVIECAAVLTLCGVGAAQESAPARPSPAGTVASTYPQLNIPLSSEALRANARATSSGHCAQVVGTALKAGGLNLPVTLHELHAKDYGPALESQGFRKVPPKGYVPRAGDIVVFQPYSGGPPSGHIAMFAGDSWISDYVQKGLYPGSGYQKSRASYVVYRHVSAERVPALPNAITGTRPRGVTPFGTKPQEVATTPRTDQPKPKDEQTEKLEHRAIEFAAKGLKPRDLNAPVDPNEAKLIIPEDCTIEVAVGDAESGATYVDTYKILGNTVTAKRPPRVSPEKNGPGYWDAEERYVYSFEGALRGNVISGTWTSEAVSEGKRYKDDSNSRLDQHAKGTVKHVENLRIVLFGDGTVTWETQTETEVRMRCLVGVFDADTGRTELNRKTEWPKQAGSAVWQIRKSEAGRSASKETPQ